MPGPAAATHMGDQRRRKSKLVWSPQRRPDLHAATHSAIVQRTRV